MEEIRKIEESQPFKDGGHLVTTLPNFLILQVKIPKPGKNLGRSSHDLKRRAGLPTQASILLPRIMLFHQLINYYQNFFSLAHGFPLADWQTRTGVV